MLCLQPVSHVHLDVSEAPQAGWHCMDSRTCNGISSLTPQAPHLQDDVPCHPVLGSETWKSCLAPPCSLYFPPNPSAGNAICLQKRSGIILSIPAAPTQVQITTTGHSDTAKTPPPTPSCFSCFPSCPPSNPIHSLQSISRVPWKQNLVLPPPSSLAPWPLTWLLIGWVSYPRA